jgi:glutamine synthetase
MSERIGLLTPAELAEFVADGRIDTVAAVFTDLYGRFMGKRFDAEYFLERIADDGTHACDYLLTVDMEMAPVAGYDYSNWQKGYGDFHLVPDLATLRVAAWLDRTALVVCDVVDPATHEPVAIAPRSMLRRQLERAAGMKLQVKAASELEFFLFRTPYRQAHELGYDEHKLEPAGWYLEDYHLLQGTREEPFNAAVRRALTASGIPVESTKGEWGRGQHELNVRYNDALPMADSHSIYKQCLKEVADQQGLSVTFMAKYSAEQAGSSCHVHLSLWQEGRNAFAGDKILGRVQCSDLFRWFLAGWIAHVPEMMVLYAPTVNSYKRYQSGSWAPTRIAWSGDNRTAGFRVVGAEDSLRIECRIPGADCNPYLTYAAALASGLDGIVRRLEPPAAYEGDVYAAEDITRVPVSLSDAIVLFEGSEFARGALGDNVVAHYAHFFRMEQAAYDRTVTDWERKRYFERI